VTPPLWIRAADAAWEWPCQRGVALARGEQRPTTHVSSPLGPPRPPLQAPRLLQEPAQGQPWTSGGLGPASGTHRGRSRTPSGVKTRASCATMAALCWAHFGTRYGNAMRLSICASWPRGGASSAVCRSRRQAHRVGPAPTSSGSPSSVAKLQRAIGSGGRRRDRLGQTAERIRLLSTASR
jgi:hypothetical protein